MAIDDAHWGDLESAMLLTEILGREDPPGMLLILSYRSEARGDSLFLSALDGSSAQATPLEIEVGTLSRRSATKLAAEVLGIADPRVIQFV